MAKESGNAFRQAILSVNSGKKFPALELVRRNPEIATTLSKLVPSIEPAAYGSDGNRQPVAPNIGAFKNTSEHISQNITDAQTIMQILPDMELAAQILVSCILSPKDMMTTELTYTVAEGLMAPDISAALIAEAKAYFEQVYKIQPLLPKMLRDMLFETGSYPVAVIPENSIDDIINGSNRLTLENLAEFVNADGSIKPLGLLGPAVAATPRAERAAAGLSLEALNEYAFNRDVNCHVTLEGILNQTGVADTYITVTDNPTLLKIPEIHNRVRESRVMNAVKGRALESITATSKKITDRQLSSVLYKERQYGYKPINAVKTQDQLARRTVGNPLILHLPSESVIPVYVPGSPEKQIGFFVLIDADGNPISKSEDTDYYQQLSSRLNTNGSFPSAMLTKVKSQMSGFDVQNPRDLDYSARAFGAMLEQDLLARLRNGVYGNGVAIGKQDEIYRIMLSRALAKQHTQLLFLPVELMTYFAFRYTPNGIGKSLMDDMKILNSLRAMLLFANVMASLKNSIGRTEVKLKLDEADPNPQKTIETAMHEIVRSRQQYFPLGMNSPTDLCDWLMRSGFEFTFEGHPGMPDVAIDFGEKATQFVKPDTDLEDNLRKQAIMSAGLSPEMVDNTFQAEFAVSIVTNNILLAKRVMQLQDQFVPLLSDHHRKVMMNSEQLVTKLRQILNNNFDKLQEELKFTDAGKQFLTSTDAKDEENRKLVRDQAINELLEHFIANFEASLPRPNSVTLENQMTALETYTKALDATLDGYISSNFFTSDTGGDIANQVDVIKQVLKAYFLRQWMTENGVMTELSSLTTLDGNGKPAVNIFEAQKQHLEAMTKTLTDFMVGLQPAKDASNKTLTDLGADLSAGGGGGGGEDDNTGGGDDTGTGGDDLGLGGDDDLFGGGGEEEQPPAGGGEPPAEEPPAEEEPVPSEDTSSTTDDKDKDKDKKAEEDKKTSTDEDKSKSGESDATI